MSETQTLTLTDFLLARIAEDEAAARECARLFPPPWEIADRGWRVRIYSANVPLSTDVGEPGDERAPCVIEVEPTYAHDGWLSDNVAHIARHDPARVLAECEAKRRIVELHKSWPVLVEKPVEFDPAYGADQSYSDQIAMRVSQQIAWLTQEEYRARFGDEPPTAPMLAALALPYADHPDYRAEWAL